LACGAASRSVMATRAWRLLLRRQHVLEVDAAVGVVPAEGERRGVVRPFNCRREESAGHVEVLVIVLAEVGLLPAAGVLAGGRPAGILADARLRMDRHVLPVSVAADDDQIFLRSD